MTLEIIARVCYTPWYPQLVHHKNREQYLQGSTPLQDNNDSRFLHGSKSLTHFYCSWSTNDFTARNISRQLYLARLSSIDIDVDVVKINYSRYFKSYCCCFKYHICNFTSWSWLWWVKVLRLIPLDWENCFLVDETIHNHCILTIITCSFKKSRDVAKVTKRHISVWSF